ncbi:cell wall-associated NlpC family hydrolase [Streptomyces sp. SAI-208]|uniref:C40 family peptidase n=1 Tax=Streptomyces sp. SAI-208 TaxID=2940550 RepID=UPI002474718D|nr:C40 family peptidase [Streptomyces sp. SAI-208]MDH6611831.1 cell wall-associated NlpC family hydrolase [Streptomyces sp. SAI-208]
MTFMAPDRTSRDGGFSLPAKRNSALATAALASAALLSQTGNAAADEAPSRDEVSRRVSNLYDRAENDSGTYNATRAAGTASSTRGRGGSSTGGRRTDGGGRSGGDPSLDAIARQWYGMARAKTGPIIEASLPADRVAGRRAETNRQRPASAATAREAKPAEQSLPERAARPVLALPSAPEPAPAPAQSPSWAPAPGPQDLTGTGGFPALGTSQPVTGVPEYTAQSDTGTVEYGRQLVTGVPEYTPPSGTAVPASIAQPAPAFPEYSAQAGTGHPAPTGQLTTAVPEYTPSPATGFPEYAAQTTTGFPEYAAQTTMGFPEYAAPATTGYADHSALTAPLATLAPLPVIPAPRSPEPAWQAPEPAPAPAATPLTLAPAPDLPTPDPGYDSKVIQVLAFARSQIGKPCVWGAAGPGSYDNSGLTQAAWKVAGVSLPRTALGQASTGTAVPLYAMQPGDLVFFHDDFSHVGLCTGNGMMIHAPGPGSSIREESIYPTGESIIRGAIRPA